MNFKTLFIIFLFVTFLGSLVSGYIYFSMEKQKTYLQEQLSLVQESNRDADYEDALTRIRPIIDLLKQSEDAHHYSKLYMDILFSAGRIEEAKSEANNIIMDYEQSEVTVPAHLLLGEIALDDDLDTELARKHFTSVIATANSEADKLLAKTGLAQIKALRGEEKEAQAELLALLDENNLPLESRNKIQETVGEINLRMLLSRAPQPGDLSYKIQKGDTLDVIARRHGMTADVLIKCNNIQNPRRVPVNTRIKVPKVSFELHVDKYTNEMLLLNDGKFFKKYRVRTGRYADETPTGEFKIINKKKNPRWTDPNSGKVYPPNDPENELGTRWMSFQGSMLGIHGTINPDSIGKYASNGCVGMLKDDIEELFDLVREGTPLKIVGVQNPKLKEKDEQ